MAIRGVTIGGVSAFVSVNRRWLARMTRIRPQLGPMPLTGDEHSNEHTDPTAAAIFERVRQVDWYHSIEFGHGVVSQGAFDHRPYLAEYRLPERLDGLRVLDIATFDGFWAFEFEKRGARDVLAIDIERFRDIDYPTAVRARLSDQELDRKTGAGFALAHELLNSKVHRKVLNVYDLSPERTGTFDMVFCSGLLLHLKCPIRALERIRSVTSGFFHVVESVSPIAAPIIEYRGGQERCVWWSFSWGTLARMVEDAGFSKVEVLNHFRLGHRGEKPQMWHVALRATV